MSSLLPVPDMGEGVKWAFEIPIRPLWSPVRLLAAPTRLHESRKTGQSTIVVGKPHERIVGNPERLQTPAERSD